MDFCKEECLGTSCGSNSESKAEHGGPIMNSDYAYGELLIESRRSWMGKQSTGAFIVVLDGRKAGKLLPEGSLAIELEAGEHTIKVRQWWYSSRSIEIAISAGKQETLIARSSRDEHFVRTFTRFLFLPWCALYLGGKESSMHLGPGNISVDTTPSDASQVSRVQQSRLSLFATGIVGFVGFLLILVGLHHNSVSLAMGITLVIVGLGLSIRAIVLERKVHDGFK